MARERSFFPSPDHQTPGLAGPGPCLTGGSTAILVKIPARQSKFFESLKGFVPKTLVDEQLWGVVTEGDSEPVLVTYTISERSWRALREEDTR